MTRTTAWLSTFSCAMILAAIGGCGSSSPANNGKGGSGGSQDAAAGAGGNGGAAAGGSGQSGDNGNDAAAGAAGATAGAGGATAGSGGATAGAGGTKVDGGDASMDTTGTTDAGGEVAQPVCGDGNRCNDNGMTCETACTGGRRSFCLCYDPAGGPVRLEYQCFMDISCTSTDAGTTPDGGTADGGTDARVSRTCPAGIMNGDACSLDGGIASPCTTVCTNNLQRTCSCGRNGWRCSTQPHICF